MPPYTKPPTNTRQQLQKLIDLGLEVTDELGASKYLTTVGYYRLKGYALQFRDLDKEGKPFKPGTSFAHLLRAHESDHHLRGGLFTIIQRLELALRAAMSEELSTRHGAHWYSDHTLFTDRPQHTTMYAEWVNHFWKQKRELFVRHFERKYGRDQLPPSWMLLETMTIGNLSRAYEQLIQGEAKEKIANRFGLRSTRIMGSWMHSLAALRNIVCHHNRLWDAEFRVKPELFKPATDYKGSSPITGNHLLGAQAYILAAMMRAVDEPAGDVVTNILRLSFRKGVSDAALLRNGFKSDWHEHEHFAYRYFEADTHADYKTAKTADTED